MARILSGNAWSRASAGTEEQVALLPCSQRPMHSYKGRMLYLEEWKVHEMANCRRGVWRAARMLNSALKKQIIVDRLGYPSMAAHYLKVRVNY